MKLQFFEDVIQYDYTRQNDVLPQDFVPTMDNMDASSVFLGQFFPLHPCNTKEIVSIS